MSLLSILSLPLTYVLPFLVVITIIVFIHELGHFLVARWCGVKVETFSIGFGREIFGWYDRHGTHWRFCWILLGGYVKFEGDANAASQPSSSPVHAPGSLHSKPVWQRMAVVAAGPIANFLLAILIFAGLFFTVGVPNTAPVIAKVESGSVAEQAGLKAGDVVNAVDGREIKTFGDLSQYVLTRGGDPLNLTIQRGASTLNIRVTPAIKEVDDGFGGKIKAPRLGVVSSATAGTVSYERLGPVASLQRGVRETWNIVYFTCRFIGKLFTGAADPKQVGSVASMAEGATNAASTGPSGFVLYIAFLSVSVGLINLFPIPVLDGGHLVFYAIESVLGRPLGQRAQEIGYRIGISLVFMMIAFGLWNDFTRIFAPFLGS
jgi:regulator of sigma E protease